MSASPLPTPVAYAPAPLPPGPPADRRRVLGSWIVILASVGLIAGLNAVKHKQPAVESLNPSAPPNVRFELTARYSIGAKRLLEQATGKKDSSNDPLYLSQIDRYVTTTTDMVREASVRAVLAGSESALERLDQLKPKVKNTPLEEDVSVLETVYRTGAGEVPARARALLIQRHGWFGKLALSWNQPASSKEAEEANAAAARAFYSVAGLGALGVGGLILGSVLFIVALVRFIDGKVKLAYRPAAEPGSAFLESFAIYVGGTTLLSLLLMIIPSHTGSRLSWGRLALSLLPVSVAMVWPLFRGVPAPEWRRGLGWTTGRGLLREMCAGITGYLAGMPVLAAGAAVTILLTSVSGADPSHPIMNEARGGVGAAIRLYVLASVFAPLVEETLFRGALFHHMRTRHGWWMSALVVSLIFAAMHPQGWAAIPVLGSIALVFAAIREWRGTIFASAAAHALNNGLVMTVLILTLH